MHISLPAESELIAVQHVIDLAAAENLDRLSYVSGTSVREENRWFEMIELKMGTRIYSASAAFLIRCSDQNL